MTPPSEARRNQDSRRAILGAAFAEASEKGLASTTIEGIAARAGVGKQTIYRWWNSKAAVLVEAIELNAATSRRLTFPDTGDIRADLRTQMRAVVRAMRSPAYSTYRGLIASAQSDPEIAKALVDTIIGPRVTACIERLKVAQRAGQVDPNADLKVMVEVLYGPLYYRLLLHTDPLTNTQVDAVLDLVLRP